jgi:uncharacterized membrane protein YoaK (UPF0700 family)
MKKTKQRTPPRPRPMAVPAHAPARVPMDLRLSLLGLTLVAGWVDALSFLGLGKVFTSFMSGNVLFCGIAAGQRDWVFFGNAVAALAMFMGGAGTGAALIHHLPPAPKRLSRPLLLAEAFVMLIFALGWQLRDQISGILGWQTALLAVAAFGMGMQALGVIILGIPGVATNALTGTVTLIARSLFHKLTGGKVPGEVNTRYLLLLCVAYTLSAGLVALAFQARIIGWVPFGLVATVALLGRHGSRTAGMGNP